MKAEEKDLQEEQAGLAFASDKGFFYSYNVIFDLPLSKNAKLLYLYLCRRADGKSKTFPSYATMASACSLSRSTAIRAMKELMAEGLLLRKHQQHGKEFTSNQYLLYAAPDEEAKRMNLKEIEQEKRGGKAQLEKTNADKKNVRSQDGMEKCRGAGRNGAPEEKERKKSRKKQELERREEKTQVHKPKLVQKPDAVRHPVRNFSKKIGETGVGFTLRTEPLKGQLEIEGFKERKQEKEGWCHGDTRGSPV